MEDVLKNVVPQAGILDNEENSATDSDRVKAPVVGAGSTDFGGSQKLGLYCISEDERRSWSTKCESREEVEQGV